MQINKIIFLPKQQTNLTSQEKKKETPKNISNPISNNNLQPQFNDYLINFTAQVDKGLDRFYEANKDRMPVTVQNFVANIEDKSKLTPLEAQQKAFSELYYADTIDEIKIMYPDEPLFAYLRNPEDNKATRGILNKIREDQDLFKEFDINVLKGKENLTVYLVQKIFLEGKTLDEINKDLENDLNEDFKADFKFKNEDAKYIYSSTLKALGIQTPSPEYQQSLRYTRNGYADEMGKKIQEGLRNFWDTMPENERNARNKHSIEKFEQWWLSIPPKEKLEMIADQVTEIELLKTFKKEERIEAKKKEAEQQPTTQENEINKPKTPHNKIGSTLLKRDELFLKWATNNLKLYEASLSEADKDTIHIKRMQRLATRWAEMTPEDRTDYINKMKAGSEPLRFTMVDAWNHSTDIIKDLSQFLKTKQILKPLDMLYSSQEFSEFQSEVMTEFWATHPEHAENLGKRIVASQEKVNYAISNGTFVELQKQIARDKNQRLKEMKNFKFENEISEIKQNEEISEPQYLTDFKKAYLKEMAPRLHNIPTEYLDEYLYSLKDAEKKYLISWTKNLTGADLTREDYENLRQLSQNGELSAFEANRAIEATLANVLYEYTRDPEVFKLSFSDVKTLIYDIEKGANPLKLYSERCNQAFIIPVIKKGSIRKQTIDNMYHLYREPLSDAQVSDIILHYFKTDYSKLNITNINNNQIMEESYDKLFKYIKQYNKSILIMTSDENSFPPAVKEAFREKFMQLLPKGIIHEPVSDFKHEAKIKKGKLAFQNKYDFLPKSFVNLYYKEIALYYRTNKENASIDDFIENICKKRKNPEDVSNIHYQNKQQLPMETKLVTLAMEEALADTLYDASKNLLVYHLPFEALCDITEILSVTKKFPNKTITYKSKSGNEINITCNKKPNFNKITSAYKDYVAEIKSWTNDISAEKTKPNWADLLYILNPEENMPDKDSIIAERMHLYGVAPIEY